MRKTKAKELQKRNKCSHPWTFLARINLEELVFNEEDKSKRITKEK